MLLDAPAWVLEEAAELPVAVAYDGGGSFGIFVDMTSDFLEL